MLIPLRLPSQQDKDAINHAHFPELRNRLRDCLQGRNAQILMAFINDDAFMNNWHISMRYADARQIRKEWVEAWQKQARDVVNAMGA